MQWLTLVPVGYSERVDFAHGFESEGVLREVEKAGGLLRV